MFVFRGILHLAQVHRVRGIWNAKCIHTVLNEIAHRNTGLKTKCIYNFCTNDFCNFLVKTSFLKCSIPIHTSSSVLVKTFNERENTYAHTILERGYGYSETLSSKGYFDNFEHVSEKEFCDIVSKNWSSESPDTVFLGFKKLSFYSLTNPQSLTDAQFERIVEALMKNCHQLNDEDLIGVLICLRNWSPPPSHSSKNFEDLWKTLDAECSHRLSKWDRNKILFVADHWYLLHLSSLSNFMQQSITRLCRKPENLTPQQLVQTMFYINARRYFPTHLSIYDIEFSLEKCIDKLTIDEIAILAMGFFKSEKPIRSQKLVLEIIRRTMNEIKSIDDILLAALLKVIRYSLLPVNSDTLYALLDTLVSQVERLSLLCCTHVALTGSTVQVYHHELIEKIVSRFVNEIQSCRLKDLERIAFVLSSFNYKHTEEPSIYELISAELQKSERTKELERYKKCLPCCLNYLSLQKTYLKDEISQVLDIKYLRNIYGNNNHKIGREILNLDIGVELECPDYTGNRLDKKIRKYLSKIYSDKIWQYEDLLDRKLNATDQMLLEVYNTAAVILGGQQKLHLGHIIPHRERADIVYGIQADGTVVDIPPYYRKIDISICKNHPEIEGTKWYCIIVGGSNFFIRNTGEPVGAVVTKMRHLRILHYNPILIPWYEWKFQSREEQEKYLARKLFGVAEDRMKCTAK